MTTILLKRMMGRPFKKFGSHNNKLIMFVLKNACLHLIKWQDSHNLWINHNL